MSDYHTAATQVIDEATQAARQGARLIALNRLERAAIDARMKRDEARNRFVLECLEEFIISESEAESYPNLKTRFDRCVDLFHETERDPTAGAFTALLNAERFEAKRIALLDARDALRGLL